MAIKARSSSFPAVVENAGVITVDFAVDWSPDVWASIAMPLEVTGFTTCASAEEVLPVKFASPLYLAVMECDPVARADVESCPVLFARFTTPIVIEL